MTKQKRIAFHQAMVRYWETELKAATNPMRRRACLSALKDAQADLKKEKNVWTPEEIKAWTPSA